MFPANPSQLKQRLQSQHTQVVAALLGKLFTKLFEPQLKQQRLNFLHGQKLAIRVEPMSYRLCLSSVKQKIQVLDPQTKTDVCISGKPTAFLMLLTQTTDADTLFFQRKLRVEGNVALGLELKHFFANLDPTENNILFQKLLASLKWILSHKPIAS